MSLMRMGVKVGISDLIQKFINTRPNIAPYDVLIIDEYQDIELELAELLKMVKDANPKMQIIAVPKYIKGKNEPESVTYVCKELEPILEPTYGCIVYQEQVMQIVQNLAGYTMGQADNIRRAPPTAVL